MFLIFVGGLVTTTESGMAVPDWPTTFGFGMLSYPIQEWLSNGWSVFIEHGHRLMGSAVGMITIAYLLAIFRWDRRRWLWMLGVVTLAAVIFQGVLGGTRVIENARTLAMIHGCFAPVFLSLCVSNAVFTSRRWRDAFSGVKRHEVDRSVPQPRPAFLLATAGLVLVAYLQIVFGAQLRHIPADASPATGVLLAVLHVTTAGLLLVLVIAVGIAARKLFRAADKSNTNSGDPKNGIRRAAHNVGLLISVQVFLGCLTWIVNFGWPGWLSSGESSQEFFRAAQGFWQTVITTGHQTTGSVILATCVTLAWRTLAMSRRVAQSTSGSRAANRQRSAAPRAAAVMSAPALAGGSQ